MSIAGLKKQFNKANQVRCRCCQRKAKLAFCFVYIAKKAKLCYGRRHVPLYPACANKQCKSAIILQCYHPHLSDLFPTPVNSTLIYPAGVAKIYLVFF